MLRKSLAVMLVLAASLAVAQQNAPAATGAPSVSTVLDQQLSRVEKDVVPMASEMPAEKYDFAPTAGEFKGVRTFADQVRHIGAGNYRIGAAILGGKPPITAEGVAALKTREQIVKFLSDSYGYAHKALGAVTAENATQPIPSPFGRGEATRLGLAIALIADQRDHYGQMVVYFRMNGMVPPASRR